MNTIERQMLIRLYADYGHLSSYVHGLTEATDIKASFGKYSDRLSTKQKEDVFHKGDFWAIALSQLSECDPVCQ